MESYKKKVNLGNQEIILESGKVARQATGSVVATCGNTQILATVVVGRPPGEHQDFFPLTVNYIEKTYATGKIPGWFFKREGRPSEPAILNCRVVDRPLMPLFPKNYHNDTQIAITVLSTDLE